MFAKAYECHCEYIDQNGVKCNGIPKLCEFNQVRINYIISSFKIIIIII